MPKTFRLCYNPQQFNFQAIQIMRISARYKFFIFFAIFISASVSIVSAQDTPDKSKTEPNGTVKVEKTGKTAKEKSSNVKKNKQSAADLIKNATPEQVAESAVFSYSGGGGRDYLKQIRKTTIERGKISITNAEGKIEQANYERYILRGDGLEKERIRFDQEFPSARYALIYNNDKVFGIFNDKIFAPREDASKSFENQIWHGLEALLRYKENGSTLALAEREKLMGVDFYVLDVTDKQNRKTRFYISTKTLRVMMLEYTEDNTKYRRKFYDYNYAQSTLVPYRSILWANDKQVEETIVQTISFGQRVQEDIFNEG